MLMGLGDLWEKQDRYLPYEEAVEEEPGYFSPDEDELAEAERMAGGKMEELDEEDLIEIVRHFLGVEAETAEWVDGFGMIKYA